MNINWKLFSFLSVFLVTLIIGFTGNISAFAEDSCLIAWDGCDSETNISEPRYCQYSVDSNAFTPDYKRIDVKVIQGGMANSDRDHSFIFDTGAIDTNFTVWVDKHTQPTYILCYGLDDGEERYILDQIVLGNAEVSMTSKKTYKVYDRDDPEVYFISFSFIIISVLSMLYMTTKK
jgi:hypothetical protein